jgi:hypothetical protein
MLSNIASHQEELTVSDSFGAVYKCNSNSHSFYTTTDYGSTDSGDSTVEMLDEPKCTEKKTFSPHRSPQIMISPSKELSSEVLSTNEITLIEVEDDMLMDDMLESLDDNAADQVVVNLSKDLPVPPQVATAESEENNTVPEEEKISTESVQVEIDASKDIVEPSTVDDVISEDHSIQNEEVVVVAVPKSDEVAHTEAALPLHEEEAQVSQDNAEELTSGTEADNEHEENDNKQDEVALSPAQSPPETHTIYVSFQTPPPTPPQTTPQLTPTSSVEHLLNSSTSSNGSKNSKNSTGEVTPQRKKTDHAVFVSPRLLAPTQARISDLKGREEEKVKAKYEDDIWWEARKPAVAAKLDPSIPSKLYEATSAFQQKRREKHSVAQQQEKIRASAAAHSTPEVIKINLQSPLLKPTAAAKFNNWKAEPPKPPAPVLTLKSQETGPRVQSKLNQDTVASRGQYAKTSTKETTPKKTISKSASGESGGAVTSFLPTENNAKKVPALSSRLLSGTESSRASVRNKACKSGEDEREMGWKKSYAKTEIPELLPVSTRPVSPRRKSPLRRAIVNEHSTETTTVETAADVACTSDAAGAEAVAPDITTAAATSGIPTAEKSSDIEIVDIPTAADSTHAQVVHEE